MTPPAPAPDPGPVATPTAWSPLRHAVFRMLWIAWLTANVSMWMNDVAAAWLMTTLSADPMLVALVQTATTLPVFLLATPGGALADIIDRRRLLLGTQLWVSATATLLAVAAWAGVLTAPALLGLVFAHGIGLAMRWPVFAAAAPEVVPRSELPQAMALNAVAMHVSRVIGPVAAGALLASLGSAAVFALNAVLSLGAAALVWRWRHAPHARSLPAERFFSAMRVGLRHVSLSRPLRAVQLRAFVFFQQITALVALLPLVAKGLPGGNAGTYTLLMSCMGLGAVATAMWMPRLRQRLAPQALLVLGTVLHAISTAVAAFASHSWIAALAMLPAGAAWIAAGNTLTVSAQLSLPDWVRARGMAIFLMSVMAGSAGGAALWGAVAGGLGVRHSLLASAAMALVLLLALRRWRLDKGATDDELVAYRPEVAAATLNPREGG